MALRVVVASAVVSRKVGRGHNRLGAFSLPAYPRDRAPPPRPRQRDHLRRRTPLHGADAAIPVYADEYDLSKAEAGLLVGAYGAGALLGGIPGGLAALPVQPEARRHRRAHPPPRVELAFAAADSALHARRSGSSRGSRAPRRGPVRSHGSPPPHRASAAARRSGRRSARRSSVPFSGRRSAVWPISSASRRAFTIVGLVALAFAALASVARSAHPETTRPAGLRRAFRDQRFLGGLWLTMLPAKLFGLLIVLDTACARRRRLEHVRDRGGVLRLGSRRGRPQSAPGALQGLRRAKPLPIRAGLTASVVVALALAASSEAAIIALLVRVRASAREVSTSPSMSLTSRRAETAVRRRAWHSARYRHRVGARGARRPVGRGRARGLRSATRRRTSSAPRSAHLHARGDVPRRGKVRPHAAWDQRHSAGARAEEAESVPRRRSGRLHPGPRWIWPAAKVRMRFGRNARRLRRRRLLRGGDHEGPRAGRT